MHGKKTSHIYIITEQCNSKDGRSYARVWIRKKLGTKLKSRSHLWTANHSRDLGYGDFPGDLKAGLHDLVDLVLKLGVDLREEVGLKTYQKD